MRALWARSNTIIPYITLVITSLAVERAAARHQPFHREIHNTPLERGPCDLGLTFLIQPE